MVSPAEKQGYLGDLSTKSTVELIDLLTRQEKLLAKTKFVESLPDQGVKVRKFSDRLRQLLSEREPWTESGNIQNRSRTVFPSGPVHKGQMESPLGVKMEGRAPHSDLHQDITDTEHRQASEPSLGHGIDKEGIKNVRISEEQKIADLQSDKSSVTEKNCDVEVSLQNLKISEDVSVLERLRKEKSTNAYNKAIQNAHCIPAASFKPNSTLKITKISDLPSEYKCRSRVQGYVPPVPVDTKSVEESAATPPIYRYRDTKLISLDESLNIQKLQKVRQEELQAKHAAEKLAQRLCVTMDTYNPEGVDMSYRNQEVDSDDELE